MEKQLRRELRFLHSGDFPTQDSGEPDGAPDDSSDRVKPLIKEMNFFPNHNQSHDHHQERKIDNNNPLSSLLDSDVNVRFLDYHYYHYNMIFFFCLYLLI